MRKYNTYASNPPMVTRKVTCLPEEEEGMVRRFAAQGMRLDARTRCANVERGMSGYRLIFKSS